MSIEVITLVMFGSIFLLLAMGLPIAFVLGSIAVAVTYFLYGHNALITIVFSTFSMMWQILFIAIPLFIFMGAVLEKSGIAEGLYEAMHRWAGSINGGLAMATVTVCVFFAAMTGITGATTITLGIIALPAMLSRGYDKNLALGSILGGGTLAILIPPSIPMVLIALFTRQSAGKMLIAGILPGLLISCMFIMYIAIKGLVQPESCPAHSQRFTLREKIIFSRKMIFPLIIIGGVLGSIFFGFATPTEASAIGAVGVVLSTIVNRSFSWRIIKEAIYATFRLTNIIMWIAFGAASFSTTYSALGGMDFIQETIVGLQVNPWMIFTVICLIIIILGCFLDPTSIIMIVSPISFEVITASGFDPTWFGIIFVICLEIGYITPPFGFNLFYLKAVAPRTISIADIIGSVVPFLLILLMSLVLFAIFPQVVLWLPNMMK
ncbi:MAG TPA: TRAP transporter large permease subunit [Desulfatiglandales bacterium]|nr:TRAP transporter large permease subunit [Desulfatiglandales bacterium]